MVLNVHVDVCIYIYMYMYMYMLSGWLGYLSIQLYLFALHMYFHVQCTSYIEQEHVYLCIGRVFTHSSTQEFPLR